MFLYYYDSNAILVKLIKSRQAATIHNAFLKIHNIQNHKVATQKFKLWTIIVLFT